MARARLVIGLMGLMEVNGINKVNGNNWITKPRLIGQGRD